MHLEQLKAWFYQTRRDLPWRDNPTPYAVWVSEVMLQQTQVAVVASYFLRWMERFPTVQALAAASLEEVLKMWEGLGYYSRARHLHQGARMVVDKYDGIIPDKFEDLAKIKGLGDYTIGAILVLLSISAFRLSMAMWCGFWLDICAWKRISPNLALLNSFV